MQIMIEKLFNNDFGAYMPGFFKIELDVALHDEFSWNEFTESEKATVIHEYIHYLQDISTAYGISNFNYLVELINLYLNKVYTNIERELIVPIDLEKSNIENAYEQSMLIGIYKGDDKHKKIHHINKICREIEDCYQMEFNPNNDSDKDIYNINIYYDDNKDIPYRFGNKCITESMAYLIETYIYPIDVRKNEFPYNACELICNEIYPEMSNNTSCIVAICDISLMHYHSGDFFYNLLLDMKKNKYLPHNIDDVYKYVNPQIKHLYQNYIKDLSKAVENINFLYSKDIEMLKPINEWLMEKLERGMRFRIRNSNFISKLMDYNQNEFAERYFIRLMNICEMPLITDKTEGVFSENHNLSLMLSPIALVELFTKSSDFKCYMYKYCVANGETQVENLCLTEPWMQAEKKHLCPLALYWHRFSLTGKSLRRK